MKLKYFSPHADSFLLGLYLPTSVHKLYQSVFNSIPSAVPEIGGWPITTEYYISFFGVYYGLKLTNSSPYSRPDANCIQQFCLSDSMKVYLALFLVLALIATLLPDVSEAMPKRSRQSRRRPGSQRRGSPRQVWSLTQL